MTCTTIREKQLTGCQLSVLSDVQEKSGGGFLDNIRALPDEGMAEAGPASTSEGPSVAGGDPQQGRASRGMNTEECWRSPVQGCELGCRWAGTVGRT
jgi:hypothetical protein